eukprot:6608121-Pyramimonas_sp.AAC.1
MAIPVPKPRDIDELRHSSSRFKAFTCKPDGFHPRHFSLLSEDGLSVLANLFHLVDILGEAPQHMQHLVIFLLGRPDKGRRPIGHYNGFARLHGKTHRDPCRQWEEA